jgi:ferredoxin
MNFANKGLPMEDPECVRCSACVQSCPTGVLSFGRYNGAGLPVLDRLPASPVRMKETGRAGGMPIAGYPEMPGKTVTTKRPRGGADPVVGNRV